MAVGKLKVRNGLCIGEGFVDYANVRIIANIVIHGLLFLGLSTTLRDSVRVCLELATLCLSSHSTGTPLAPHHHGHPHGQQGARLVIKHLIQDPRKHSRAKINPEASNSCKLTCLF